MPLNLRHSVQKVLLGSFITPLFTLSIIAAVGRYLKASSVILILVTALRTY